MTILITRATTRGAKGDGAPLNKNFAPHPNCPACPPKLLFSLRQFQDGGYFFGNQERTRRKADQIGAMTFLFYCLRSKNLEKSRLTQKFWPTQKQTLPRPLEQRSSRGTADHMNWVHPPQPGHVVESLDKRLYNDYRCLVVSSKQ